MQVIDTVGYEPEPVEQGEDAPQPSKMIPIDIKIGYFTKSGQQFRIEGGSWLRPFKWLEHNVKDKYQRESRDEGYDIDAGDFAAFDEEYKKDMLLETSPLKPAMHYAALHLLHIGDEMRKAPVTFVGASVFIVLNLTNPQRSAASLIDPDHPIILEKPSDLKLLGVPKDVMADEKVDRDWGEYKKKWNDSFDNGFVNFFKWYKDRSVKPPGPPPTI